MRAAAGKMKGVNPDLQGGMDGVGTEQQQQNQPTLSPEEEAAAREARRALLRVWMAKHGWATEGADTGENSVPASAAAVPHVPNVAEIAAASGVNVDEVYTMLTEEVAAGGDPAAVAAAAEALKQPLSLAEEMALLAARAAGIQARGRTGPQPAGGRLGKKGKGKKGGGAAKDTAAGEVVPEQVEANIGPALRPIHVAGNAAPQPACSLNPLRGCCCRYCRTCWAPAQYFLHLVVLVGLCHHQLVFILSRSRSGVE